MKVFGDTRGQNEVRKRTGTVFLSWKEYLSGAENVCKTSSQQPVAPQVLPERRDLKRINGRIKKTEILLIFFGIHTANAIRLAKRIAEAELSLAA